MTETEKSRVYCSIVVATSRTLRESVGKSRHIGTSMVGVRTTPSHLHRQALLHLLWSE